MIQDLTIAELDTDGALAESAAAALGTSRVEFLQRLTLGGGALLAALAHTTGAEAAYGKKRDVAILNFALVLEHLQADFYTEAERAKALTGGTAEQARVVGSHERAHVAAFKKALGSAAIKKPQFDFQGVTERQEAFRRTAVALEDVSVAAYAGQAPNIQDKGYLVAAVGVLSVEARHAAWIRRLAGKVPAATAFDQPRSKASVTKLVRATHFIASPAKVTSRRSPRYTG